MTSTVQIQGVGQAIRSLKAIDKDARKEFVRDAKKILQPGITEIQNAYPAEILSGLTRAWTVNNRQKFPYDQRRARMGVVPKVDAGRRTKSPIKILQRDPAATIIEFAGRRRGNPLAQSLDSKFGTPGRFAWPAAVRRLSDIQAGMEKSILAVINRVNRENR